jgi:hypothetical protein
MGAPKNPRKKKIGRPRKDPKTGTAAGRAYARMYSVIRKDPVAWADWQLYQRKDRAANPERYYRTGVADGMTRDRAMKEWAIARGKAELFMEMIDEPIEPNSSFETVIPETDEGKARLALHEVTTIVLSRACNMGHRLEALRTLLAYTKEKPVQKTDTKISSAEDWLKAALEASKR